MSRHHTLESKRQTYRSVRGRPLDTNISVALSIADTRNFTQGTINFRFFFLRIELVRFSILNLFDTLDTLPRSAVIISFDQQPYVIISLADGPIVYYFLNTEKGFLYERRKVPLGTKPTTLTFCQHPDLSTIKNVSSSSNRVLLACSDRPTVISSCNGKLVFSAVNLREIICMCSFDSEFYGSSLTLVTDAGVILGRINDLQKLHVRSLPMGESPRRIALIEQEKVFVVLTQITNNAMQNEFNSSISQQAQHKLTCPTEIQSLKATNSSDIRSSILILDQHTCEGNIDKNRSKAEHFQCLSAV